MPANTAVSDAQQTVTAGLDAVSGQLQAALATTPVDAATVMALDGLRSRYVLDQMQITRAAINVLDNSNAMKSALQSLSQAVSNLKSIQESASASTNWVNSAAGKLDELMDAIGISKSITASANSPKTTTPRTKKT